MEVNFDVQSCVRWSGLTTTDFVGDMPRDCEYRLATTRCFKNASSCHIGGPFPKKIWEAMVKCKSGEIYVAKKRLEWPEEFRLHVDRAVKLNPGLEIVIYDLASLTAESVLFNSSPAFFVTHKKEFPIPYDEIMHEPAYNVGLPPDDLVNGRLRDFILRGGYILDTCPRPILNTRNSIKNYVYGNIGKSAPIEGLIPANTWEDMITCRFGMLYHTEDTSKWPPELELHLDRAMQRNTGLRISKVASLADVKGIGCQVVPTLTAGLLLGFNKQHGESGYDTIFSPFLWREFMIDPAYNLKLPPDNLSIEELRQLLGIREYREGAVAGFSELDFMSVVIGLLMDRSPWWATLYDKLHKI